MSNNKTKALKKELEAIRKALDSNNNHETEGNIKPTEQFIDWYTKHIDNEIVDQYVIGGIMIKDTIIKVNSIKQEIVPFLVEIHKRCIS